MSTFGKIGATTMLHHLPYDSEVEYLKLSASGPYIDTGLYAVSNLSTKLVVSYSKLPTYITVQIFGFDGDYRGGDERTYLLGWKFTNVSHSLVGLVCNGRKTINDCVAATCSVKANVPVTLEFNAQSNTFNFNGVTVLNPYSLTYTSDKRTNVLPLRLFQCLQNGNSVNPNSPASNFRLHSACFKLGDVIVHDFIPVRAGSVGYMYDRANPAKGPYSNGLYPNSGTDYFGVGPDVVSTGGG